MATLYVVGTPIGNLDDITLRGLAILKSADLVLCEDTRVTKKLLDHYGIEVPTMSYHSQSGLAKLDKIIENLEEGKNVALVSDAGTPTISDPGSVLISTVKKTLPQVQVVSIPGPSAVTAALSIAGVPASDFLFLGFLPHKKGRETLFGEIKESKRTVVFYESPHRIIKTLTSLDEHMGERTVHLARELTKIHEEVLSGKPEKLLQTLETLPEKARGEFVVVVDPVK
tara:strand:- start:3535 stop:4215 length:681 start_codon:yes stop_codon:yes gene_type:complete